MSGARPSRAARRAALPPRSCGSRAAGAPPRLRVPSSRHPAAPRRATSRGRACRRRSRDRARRAAHDREPPRRDARSGRQSIASGSIASRYSHPTVSMLSRPSRERMRATELRTCCSHVRGGASPHHASARSAGGTVLPRRTTSAASIVTLARAERRSPRLERAEHLEHHDGSVDLRDTPVNGRAQRRISAGYRPVPIRISALVNVGIDGPTAAGRRRRTDMNTNIIGRRARSRSWRSSCWRALPRSASPPARPARRRRPRRRFRADRPEAARSDADRELWRATRRPGCRGDRAGGPGRAAAVIRTA